MQNANTRCIKEVVVSFKDNPKTQQFTDLLSVCLKTTYFINDGTFYPQCEGAATGLPVSPIIANLFMEHFEDMALSSFTSMGKFYGRHVEDRYNGHSQAFRGG